MLTDSKSGHAEAERCVQNLDTFTPQNLADVPNAGKQRRRHGTHDGLSLNLSIPEPQSAPLGGGGYRPPLNPPRAAVFFWLRRLSDPKRGPSEPRTALERSPNGPRTDPARTPNGSRTKPERIRADPKRTPIGP